MEIGKKLKAARMKCGLTQENAAEGIEVTRQSISNWENEKCYPDIVSVIKLSELYSVNLDDLLKGDSQMMEHLEESTNIVKSNQKLLISIFFNLLVVAALLALNFFIPANHFYLAGVFCLMIISSSALLYQIIKKF